MLNKDNIINVKVEFITIPLEEYNDLLIFKGRYLELSNMFDSQQVSESQSPEVPNPNLKYDKNDVKITDNEVCEEKEVKAYKLKEEPTYEDLSFYSEGCVINNIK